MNDELPFAPDPPPAEPDLEAAKAQIDAMTYEQMLEKVRYAPLGDPLFRGKVGIYFHAVYKKKRGATSPGARVEISKRVG